MAKTSTISAALSCANCGGSLTTAENNPTDDSIVKCKSCGHVFGTRADVYAKGREAMGNFGLSETKRIFSSGLESAFKGIKGVKFKKR